MEKRKANIDFTPLMTNEENRKSLLLKIVDLRHKRNVVSGEIAELKKNKQDAEDLVVQMREVSGRIKELEKSLAQKEEKIQITFIGTGAMGKPMVRELWRKNGL